MTTLDLAGSQGADTDTILAGKYRLGPVIGTGGMGTVYRATHQLLGRPVAVKLMHRNADPLHCERFLREARVAAAACHPNVIDVLDFGEEAGQPFMVMELLEGRSLRELYEDGIEFTFDEQLDIICQLLCGLEAVHRAGIVHRDIKPANLMLTETHDGAWVARLLDFGISFSVDGDSPMRRGKFGTDARLLVGTPEYMSIEQCEGRPEIDARTDVYAVGVMLYELLSGGKLPYESPNPGAVLYQVITGDHVPLIELRPDLELLCALVESCLERDPALRPQSARELRHALRHAAGYADSPSAPRSIPPAVGPRGSVSRASVPVRAESLVIHIDEEDEIPSSLVAPPPTSWGRKAFSLGAVAAGIGALMVFGVLPTPAWLGRIDGRALWHDLAPVAAASAEARAAFAQEVDENPVPASDELAGAGEELMEVDAGRADTDLVIEDAADGAAAERLEPMASAVEIEVDDPSVSEAVRTPAAMPRRRRHRASVAPEAALVEEVGLAELAAEAMPALVETPAETAPLSATSPTANSPSALVRQLDF